MLKRTVTGLTLVAILVGAIVATYFVSGIFVDMLILVFAAGSAYEMFKCFKKAGYKMFAAPPIFVLLTAYPVFYLMEYYLGDGVNASAGLQGLAIVLLAGVMLCLTIFTFKPAAKPLIEKTETPDANSTENNTTDSAADKTENAAISDYVVENATVENSVAEVNVKNGAVENNAAVKVLQDSKTCGLADLLANVFILIYPLTFLSMAWVISYKYCAIFAVMYAVAVPILGSDTFAYFFGVTIGGKKLCPKISPKKTIAGAVGGIFGALVATIAFWLFFEYYNVLPECGYVPFISHTVDGWAWKTALIYLAIGLVGGVVSELGDLAASRIKRAIGVKDYGNIFPGHGGFMDRMDSLMYCIVVLLVAFTAIYGY